MFQKRCRLLLANEHREWALEALEPGFEVVGCEGQGNAMVQAAIAYQPEVALVQIPILDADRLETVRVLRQCLPKIKLIVLTARNDLESVHAALEAGADGYILKPTSPHEVNEAAQTVLAGRTYVASEVASGLLGSLLVPESAPSSLLLTQRETQVASLVADGLENAEIASRLCIAEVTVRTHFRSILNKLALKNRVELARYAIQRGWSSLFRTSPVRARGATSPN